MVVAPDSLRDAIADRFETEYDDAAAYADGTVLHEGTVRVRANGWVELPTGRLLSPSAVHHVDVHPA